MAGAANSGPMPEYGDGLRSSRVGSGGLLLPHTFRYSHLFSGRIPTGYYWMRDRSPSGCQGGNNLCQKLILHEWNLPEDRFRRTLKFGGEMALAEKAFSAFFTQRNLGGTFSINRKSTRLNSSHLVISYAVFC